MEKTDEEKKIRYIINGSCNAIPESYVKLRSYLNIYTFQIARSLDFKLPKFFKNKNVSCLFCFTSWKYNSNSFKLLPSTGKRFKCMNKDGKAVRVKIINGDPELYDTKNRLVLKCRVCLKKTLFSLVKPKKFKKGNPVEEVVEKRKKKKKKQRKPNLFSSVSKTLTSKASKKKKKTETLTYRNQNNQTTNPQNEKNQKSSGCVCQPTLLSDVKSQPKENIAAKYQGKNKIMSVLCKPNKKTDCKKDKKRLAALRRAAKEVKVLPKSSLRDFLTPVGK